MSDQEYQQLVKGSVFFQDLDRNLQDKVMNATGELREFYIRTFQEEAEMMKVGITEFATKNDQVIANFTASINAGKFSQLKKTENQDKARDEQELDQLLKSI